MMRQLGTNLDGKLDGPDPQHGYDGAALFFSLRSLGPCYNIGIKAELVGYYGIGALTDGLLRHGR